MLWVCPPLIINEEELRLGLDIVEEALAVVDAMLSPTSTAQPVETLARK
jgi:taurine--2-oxoglutarate transaminase